MKLIRSLLIATVFFLSGLLALHVDGRWFSLGELRPYLEPYLGPMIEKIRRLDIGAGTGTGEKLVESLADPLSHTGMHGAEFFCTSADSTGIQQQSSDGVYRWRDSDGQIHYGDAPPENVDAERMDLGPANPDYFSLQVTYPAGVVPTGIGAAVQIGGRAIYKIYSDMLSLERMSKAEIKVLVFGNEREYQNYKSRVAPEVSASIDGYYSWSRNEAVVFHRSAVDATAGTALHEAVHVINARNFGEMPKWFNEGTAEYFENLVVRGQSTTIEYEGEWLAGLGSSYAILPLPTLLNATREEWAGAIPATYYANAWALVYFLMLPENRATMAALQVQLATDKCDGIDSVAFFQGQYPGGVAQLERDWREWLNGRHSVPTSF